MIKIAKGMAHRLLRLTGYSLSKPQPPAAPEYPSELSPSDIKLVEHVKKKQLSMCSQNNLLATLLACNHAVARGIEGSFVECGVWRGGHGILAAHAFQKAAPARKVFLYDTFEGMTAPTEVDNRVKDSAPAIATYQAHRKETHTEWCYASLDEVQTNFRNAGLLDDRVHFIKGPVESTLSSAIFQRPDKISVLRLDTDWFESTRLELKTLWPLLSPGGIMVIDDYGYWAGCRKAVDEFFGDRPPFLHYIDQGSRLVIKA